MDYWHFAIRYAVSIVNVLPAKSLTLPDGSPTCPITLAFGNKPKIGNFRVFGCPAAIKHYTATTHTGREVSYQWLLGASKLDLTPAAYAWGPAPAVEIAVPGVTPLV